VPGAGCLPQRVLRVAPPALSARTRADVELTAQIAVIHRESRGTYGAPRIHAELVSDAVHIGRKRVARLMRGAGVRGVSRRKAFTTTVRDAQARPALDLVERQFTAAGPDRLWVADITYVGDGYPSPYGPRPGCAGITSADRRRTERRR
jgi:transposase InsO family protein